MKKFTLLMLLCFTALTSKAQNDIDALLAAGVDNAEQFANDYLMPGTNGLMHSMNSNWFNTADAKPLGGFEISIVANAATVKDENKTFLMNLVDYNSNPDQDFVVSFTDTSTSKSVSTALGENDPDIDIVVTYDDPILGEQQEVITLPSGIGSETANLLPTAFIQGALGLGKGIEIKARFVPKIDTEDVDISMYGAGLQMEFTKWLPADKILPVAISGLVAYTHLDGSYDLTESSGVSGNDQRLENDTNTWLFQLIASTKLPVINFYGGLGYIKGKSESDLLGTYTVSSGPFFSETITDPFSVSSEVSSVRGTIGTKLKLGFFRLNAEYHLSEFNAFSVGINFGFR
ncbi:hypothetical protein E1J38_006565 [Seonamhaeicola sediminis]|uniref:Outer membrane protein beta-barrel domain-containing protein n=1 Tax=Seonamhaeicola sediminis TaxID=2528206 RepID=A0A562YD08_9FLAO|nr:DUF6588 family protein [Seonamhaeicola sediminis]TWO32531.1 hypothetical protein E1J38_006565 [Seonamhaeicola sediminis]